MVSTPLATLSSRLTRPTVAGVGLVAAWALFAASQFVYPGPAGDSPAEFLADIDQHTSIAYQSVVLMYVSSLLFAPALLSLAGLVRGRGATLAFVATCVFAWASSATPWAPSAAC